MFEVSAVTKRANSTGAGETDRDEPGFERTQKPPNRIETSHEYTPVYHFAWT